MDTQIINGMTTLTLWKMRNYKMWYMDTNTKCCKKWLEDKQNEKVLGQANNQAPITWPAQERRCVHTTSKGTFV
jgi:hypothetical protein